MRKRRSPLQDFFDFAFKLPWWGGFLLAVVSYVVLQLFAGAAAINGEPGTSGRMGTIAIISLVKGFATMLQYVVPLIFIVAGVGSGVKAIMRSKEYDRVAPAGLRAVADLSWHAFERLVGEAFRRKGYSVIETDKGPDGGIDLILRRAGEEHLVQCKHWRANKVGVNIVRELHGVMASRGAAGGFVVTAGEFTAAARNYAHGRNIELVGGYELKLLLDEGAATLPHTANVDRPLQPSGVAVAEPDCPSCGGKMVERVAKRGANKGGRFWGCRSFPKCSGTLPKSRSG